MGKKSLVGLGKNMAEKKYRIIVTPEANDDLATEVQSFELTEDEKRIIDERLKAYHKNPALGSPWEEVYKRIVTGMDKFKVSAGAMSK